MEDIRNLYSDPRGHPIESEKYPIIDMTMSFCKAINIPTGCKPIAAYCNTNSKPIHLAASFFVYNHIIK